MIAEHPPVELARLFERVAPVFRVLAHPARLGIVNALLGHRLTVNELSEHLDLPQSTVSQHLAQMRAHGLVEPARDGTRVFYRVSHPAARTVIACIRDHCL